MTLDVSDIDDFVNIIMNKSVPEGVIKKVPFSTSRSVIFSYEGTEITISNIYLNLSSNCYYFDMKWGDGENESIYGIPIKSGINLLEQFNCSPIKTLYAFDVKTIGGEIVDYSNLILYMIDRNVS